MSGSGGIPGMVPAGWYRNYDGSSSMRYWDGARWTEHVRPLPDSAPPQGEAPGTTGNDDEVTDPGGSGAAGGDSDVTDAGSEQRAGAPGEITAAEQPGEGGSAVATPGAPDGPPGGFAGAPPALPEGGEQALAQPGEVGASGYPPPEALPGTTAEATGSDWANNWAGAAGPESEPQGASGSPAGGAGYPAYGPGGYPAYGPGGYPAYGPGGYPGYGAPAYPGQGVPAGGGPTNSLAIVSLISSLVWLCGLGSLVGIVTGHVSRHQIKKSAGGQAGSGLALAGLLLGYLGLAGLAGGVALVILAASSANVEGQIDDAFADAAIQIDLEDAAAAQEAWYQENGGYTSSLTDLKSVDFFALDDSVYEDGIFNMVIFASETGYCMQATAASGSMFHHDSASGPGVGPCPAAQGSSAGTTES